MRGIVIIPTYNERENLPVITAGIWGAVPDLDILDRDAVDDRRAHIDWSRLAGLHPGVVAVGIAMVVCVGRKRGLDAVHKNAAHSDIGDRSTTPAPRLKAQAAICTDHGAILDRNVVHAARHFRTNDEPPVATLHQAVAHPHATRFAQMVILTIWAAFAGLHGDAIIPDGKAHAGDCHVATTFRIEAIGIWAVERSGNE